MKKIHKKYYLSISLGALGVIALFLYAMIVYFPQRNTQGTPINEADLAHVRNMDIQALRSFSGDYIVSTNTIKAFEKFYAQTHDQKVAVSLLEMYISHYRFDDAFELIKNIYHNDIDFSIVPAPTFLYILFNSAQLSPSNYDLIHSILDDYKTHGRIDADTYTFYNGLLTLYAGDTTGFYHTITNLSGSQEYQSIVSSIQNATKTSDDLGAHISYYVDGLSAVALLQEGYFRVAQKWAVLIRAQDTKYILPYQILAQAALLQSHWEEATQYFDTLLKTDNTHPSQYHFGLCASNFRRGEYEQALLHCQQVKDKSLPDALRYTLLSYYQMKDWQGMMDTFQIILHKQDVSENDYYAFFDIVFFQPFVTDKDFSHMQKYYVSVVLPYLSQCVVTFTAASPVCKYGQAGFYLYKNELPKAYKDLLFLASRHPSSYVFRALGQYYQSLGEEDKAKAYYLRAMTTATGGHVDMTSASLAGNSTMNE